MPDWTSPPGLIQDEVEWYRLLYALLGLYIWEIAISIDFDFEFLTGRRKFRWPLIFYFFNRYFMLCAYVCLQGINCKAIYTSAQLFRNMSVGLASVNLSLRTMAVWKMSPYIVVPLVVLIMGQWSILLRGVTVEAQWVDGLGCVIADTSDIFLAVSFIYSICLDFIVLVLTAWGLPSRVGWRTSSRIAKLIFQDGLIYFILTFCIDTLAIIFMMLNLNSVLSNVLNIPAPTLSTVVACRAVQRLTNWNKHDPELISLSAGDEDSGVNVQAVKITKAGQL
ncbi:hypothetical protein CERSUDRAFT_124868 [Gelatoporia subvermispora B]|uniref:Uncharacterized protein n=1 Tax=Ceriporiopsis subvermispora (strain B) TaxID=914234 RepID=M2RB22_CERS8|nr:hypothetical protein CERSUDRAFT_124868 [Gelatoporia subvermispora B]